DKGLIRVFVDGEWLWNLMFVITRNWVGVISMGRWRKDELDGRKGRMMMENKIRDMGDLVCVGMV
ncbi:hypothetical protein, partial [Paenibacillus xylanexedens]|uniref:hypothetical protein n=1 Tax=Paenibacillus xylanexedens TaxID=528191 RepID=UPI001C92F362